MGRIVKQVSEGTTKYYWYPGDKKEWIRAGAAVGAGAAVFGLLRALTRDSLLATVAGTSVTAAVCGGQLRPPRRPSARRLPDLAGKKKRRAAVGHTGRAAWRALAQGFGGAAAAVLILNLPHRGMGADWVLPIVPAVVGALAHQAGMLYERLGASASTPGPAKTLEAAK
jgi:hypothetical protein